MSRRTSSRLYQVATATAALLPEEPQNAPRARGRKKAAPAAASAASVAGAVVAHSGATPPKGAETKVPAVKVALARKRKLKESGGGVETAAENAAEKAGAVGSADKAEKRTKERPVREKTLKEKTLKIKPEKVAKVLPDREMEFALWKEGFECVAGVDEAGRGPLAGPVVAAACILPKNADQDLLHGINDSKDVREEQREEIYERLINHPDVHYAIGIMDHNEIDRVNILKATMNAMAHAVALLPCAPDYVLIDGNRCPTDLTPPSRAVVGGDAKVTAIAAASIIAKVTRDRIMRELDQTYPLYGFGGHKGYGTAAHRQLIHQHGPSEVHRKSFNPVKTMLGWTPPEGYSVK